MGKSRETNDKSTSRTEDALLFRLNLTGVQNELADLFKQGLSKGFLSPTGVLQSLQTVLAEATRDMVADWIQQARDSGELTTAKGKQELAKKINNACRRCDMYIRHPETKEKCFLLAINDKWGGKFVLESKETKSAHAPRQTSLHCYRSTTATL